MAHIFIIAGHGHGDSGATGGGYTEAERVRALANKIKQYGGNNVTVGDTSRNWYADNGISSLNISKDWQIIELHMDAASASARGGHVIINSTFTPDKYDKALASYISGILPGRSQTIVKRNDLANPKRAAAKGYPYRLLECGFISNATDRKIFNENIDEIAKGILKAFNISVSGSGSTTSSSQSNTTTSDSSSSNTKSTNYKVKINTKSGVNVRKGAGTGYSIIKAIANGTTCTIIKESSGWGYAKEYGGWISLQYTQKITTTSSSNTNSNGGSTTIKNAQKAINSFCNAGLAVDGLMGPKTRNGIVKALQTALNKDYRAGLAVDGIRGTKTNAALGNHYVKRGETQYLVTFVEIALAALGYYSGSIERPGIFGSGLETATYNFQKATGLSADKIAGKNTILKMLTKLGC